MSAYLCLAARIFPIFQLLFSVKPDPVPFVPWKQHHRDTEDNRDILLQHLHGSFMDP